MIQLMRSKAASWVARILAVLLIVSFAVWGIEDMFRAPGVSDVVAEVGPTEISRQQFNAQFTRVLNAMRERLGPEFDTQQAVQLGLLDQTIEQMVNARLMTLEAKRLGLEAGEELIRQTIFGDDRFHGSNERFDRNLYQTYLAQEGMPEGAYVATLRERIIRDQVAGALGAATTVPKILLDTVHRYQTEQRVADVVTIPLGKAEEIPDPDDAALAEFHKNNPALFTAPEYRKVTAIYLDPDELSKGLTPSEDRIRQEFEHRKATLAVPERRTVEQALFQDEDKAKALSEQIKQGRSFKDAVVEATGKEPVPLGTLTKRDLPDQAMADAVFGLAKGAASGPVKSVLGWHILRVTDISPGIEPTLAQYHDRIRAEIAREMAIDDIIKLTEKLDDALGGGAPLDEAASTVGTQALKIDAVDTNGLDPSGKPVANLPKSPVFLERVFTTPQGETTNIEEARNGGFFTLRVDAITPPALRPLADVRAQAIAEWKKSRVRDAAKEKAEKLQNAAKAASSLSHVAKESGYKVTTSKPFTRFGLDGEATVPPELAAALFNARQNEPVVVATPEGYAIGSVTSVVPPEPAKNADESKALKQQLEQALTSDAISQFLDGLRKRFPVEINRAALEAAAGVSSGG